jgi:SnoaL-like polyketide cyclase
VEIPGRRAIRTRLPVQNNREERKGSGPMSGDDNLELMKTLDDAWNAQDWEVFRKRHAQDTAVYWPGQPDPTRGRDNHQAESVEFFKSIENSLENNPYKVMFASGDRATGPARSQTGRAEWLAP